MQRLLTRPRARNLALFATVALGALAWIALSVPYFDDGLDGHMVLDSPPYWSEPHGIYFPVYKPLTTILLPLRFVPHPWAFMLASAFHAALVAASGWLTYKVARRYASEGAAALAGVFLTFAVIVHPNVVPIRPEGILLAALLAVVYLCDAWRLEGGAWRLALACGLTGALALPMHSNASILYIYLVLFAVWQRHALTRRDWLIAGGALTLSSLIGLAVILFPHPSNLIELMRQLGGQDQRYTFVLGEAKRFVYLYRPGPLLPLSMFFGLVGLAAVALARPSRTDVAAFARRYWGILIVALAAFIGLALLPSAEWPYYIVFHFPALCVLGALAYLRPPPDGLRLRRRSPCSASSPCRFPSSPRCAAVCGSGWS